MLCSLPRGAICSCELPTILKVLNSEKQQLKTLEDRNAMLERDVQRFNERKEFERQVGFLIVIFFPGSHGRFRLRS